MLLRLRVYLLLDQLLICLAVLLALVTGLASGASAAEAPDAQVHRDRGKDLVGQARWDEAIAEYEAARRLAPDDARTEYLLAYSYASKAYRDGDRSLLDSAIAGFRRALVLAPEFPEALNELGTAHSIRGEHGQAIDAFRRAIELRPEWAIARYNLADALRGSRQWDQALAAYRGLLERPGDYAASLHRVHAAMGQVYENAGRLDDAVTAFRRALASTPDFFPARLGLGNVYAQQGRLEEAIAEYERVVALQPQNPELDYLIGQLHAIRRANDLAITWLASALRKGWPNPEAIKHNPLFRRFRSDPRFLALFEG